MCWRRCCGRGAMVEFDREVARMTLAQKICLYLLQQGIGSEGTSYDLWRVT